MWYGDAGLVLTCRWMVSPARTLTSDAYPSIAGPSSSGVCQAVVPFWAFSAWIGFVVSDTPNSLTTSGRAVAAPALALGPPPAGRPNAARTTKRRPARRTD